MSYQKQSMLNNSSGGQIRGNQSGVKNRSALPPIKNAPKQPSNADLQTAQNATFTNVNQVDQSAGLMRNIKEEGQIEMGALDHDSNSQDDQQVIRSKHGSYISANSGQRMVTASSKEDSFSRIHRTLSKCFCSGAVFWLYIIFIVIFGIINISVCVSAGDELSKLQDSEAYLFAQETLTEWHKRFIMDIQITKSDTCPQNYEEALDYKWPGTLQGCACPYTEQNRQQIFLVKGKCNSELLTYNCYDVDPTVPQYIRNWKNGQRLCIKRDSVYSFFNSPTSCNSNSASTTVRSCGSGQTAICRQTNQECPVSYIQSQNSDNIVGNVQKQLKIDDSVTFSFETQSSHYPVSSFRVDEYSHCEHTTEQQISQSKRGDYVLLNNIRKLCTFNDTRPILLDTVGEETLFRQNPQLWGLIMQSKKLPAYPRPSNSYNWILSSMPYPTWTMSCRDSSKYSLPMAEEKFDLDKEEYNQVHLVSTTAISLTMISIILVIIELRRKFIRITDVRFYKEDRFFDSRFNNNRFGRVLYPREKGWVRNTYIITVVHWCFRILNLPSIFISYVQTQDSIDWYNNAVSYQCGDTFFQNNIANDYKDRLNQLKEFYSVMLGFWWVLFFIDIFYIIFRFFYEILPAQEEEYLTDLIVKGGDKQEVIPIMHKSKAISAVPASIPNIPQQQPIIEEEVIDDDNLFDDEKKQ